MSKESKDQIIQDGRWKFQFSPGQVEIVTVDDGKVHYSNDRRTSLNHFARKYPSGIWLGLVGPDEKLEPASVSGGAIAASGPVLTDPANLDRFQVGESDPDAITAFAAERTKQRDGKYGAKHDDAHTDESLLECGLIIAREVKNGLKRPYTPPKNNPGWQHQEAARILVKHGKDARHLLVIAGALIAAEIDRRDRAFDAAIDAEVAAETEAVKAAANS